MCSVRSRWIRNFRRSDRPSEVMVRVAMAMARVYVTFVELPSVLPAWETRDDGKVVMLNSERPCE